MYYNVYQKDDSDLHVHMTNEFSGNLHWKSPLGISTRSLTLLTYRLLLLLKKEMHT